MLECERQNLPLNWNVIIAAGINFAQKLGYPEGTFRALNGWRNRFKKRYDISRFNTHGKTASADTVALANELPLIIDKIRQYDARDVYNMDETSILYCNPPLTTIGTRRIQGMKQDKSRLTVALTVNAVGSDFRELLFVGKSLNPKCFGKGETGIL